MRIMKLGHKLKAFQNQWIWDNLIWFWLISTKGSLTCLFQSQTVSGSWEEIEKIGPGREGDSNCKAKDLIPRFNQVVSTAAALKGHCLSAETQQRTNHLNMGQCHDHRSTILSSQSLVAEIEIIWMTSCSWIQIISCTFRFTVIASLRINRLMESRAFSHEFWVCFANLLI